MPLRRKARTKYKGKMVIVWISGDLSEANQIARAVLLHLEWGQECDSEPHVTTKQWLHLGWGFRHSWCTLTQANTVPRGWQVPGGAFYTTIFREPSPTLQPLFAQAVPHLTQNTPIFNGEPGPWWEMDVRGLYLGCYWYWWTIQSLHHLRKKLQRAKCAFALTAL